MKDREAPYRSYGIAPSAFRLPDAARVGAVRLQVSNLQQSLEYYEQVLGLRARTTARDTATLGPHGEDPALVTIETRRGVLPARRRAFGLYHFALLLPDRASLGRFAAHVSTLGVRISMADHLVSEAIYLWDPDGLGIEVYADRPRGSWRQNGRELAVTTEPLDLRSVIAAGGGTTWEGVPSRTTMGHVHLHVGSLSGAEDYYHRALGLDKTGWSYPGTLFLSAGGYHHHVATNTWARGPSPPSERAQLLEWELIVPTADDVSAVARSLRACGYSAEEATNGLVTADPWRTRVRVRAEQRAVAAVHSRGRSSSLAASPTAPAQPGRRAVERLPDASTYRAPRLTEDSEAPRAVQA